jgi:hypothetical protein
MSSQSDEEIILSCEKKCQKDQIVWKRPNQFPDAGTTPYVLFQEAIEPNDIKQVRFQEMPPRLPRLTSSRVVLVTVGCSVQSLLWPNSLN